MSSSMPFRWSSSPFKEWNSSESRRLKQRIPGKFCQKPSTRSSCASCSFTSVLYSSLWQSLPGRRSQNKAVRSFKSFSGRNSGCRFDHQLCRHRCRLFDFEQRHLSTGRHLYQLARESHSQKMKFLTKVSDRGIPSTAFCFLLQSCCLRQFLAVLKL